MIEIENDACDYYLYSNSTDSSNRNVPCLADSLCEREIPFNRRSFARAQVIENVGGDAVSLDEQPDQEVLRAHVGGAHPAGLLEGDLDDLLDPGGGDDLLDHQPLAAAEDRSPWCCAPRRS